MPIVPREGGSSEVATMVDLVYDNDDDAVGILVRLAVDKAFYNKCYIYCHERAKIFFADAYFCRQKKLLDKFISAHD